MVFLRNVDSSSSSQDGKNVFHSFLTHQTDRIKCKKNYAEGCRRDPWDYQRYMDLVKNCLKTIIKISKEIGIESQKNYTEEILSRAHFIGDNPVGYIAEKSFQHRVTTVQAGNQLSSSFEKLCMQLQIHARKKIYRGFDADAVAQDLNKFFNTWEFFESQYRQDLDDARDFFDSQIKEND
ncbi:MAG: hypothetical protein KR126chlam3_00266 [Chlamydiae bacterium]|nr:hypothetical protein [Chlamydiota bacterium]